MRFIWESDNPFVKFTMESMSFLMSLAIWFAIIFFVSFAVFVLYQQWKDKKLKEKRNKK